MKIKVIDIYTKALLTTTFSTGCYFSITSDILFIIKLLNNTKTLKKFLNNPVYDFRIKSKMIKKLLNLQVTPKTMDFLILLINKNRIQYLENILKCYINSIYVISKIHLFEIISANKFTKEQKQKLIIKLKLITNSNKIKLIFKIDCNLLGGFLVRNDLQLIDLTLKSKINRLSKYLNC